MSQHRWVSLCLGVFLLVLILLPYLLVALAGWPGAVLPTDAMQRFGISGDIAVLSPVWTATELIYLTRLTLLSAGVGLGIALGLALALGVLTERGGVGECLSPSARLRLLVVMGALSAVLYWLNFLVPFPLRRYYGMALHTMGVIAGRNAGIALSLTVATLALFLLYGMAYRLCRGQDDRRLWGIVLLGGLIFAVIALLMFPASSLDVYDYIARGRITAVHGGNPYVQPSREYAFDPFMGYGSWQDATSPYGPLWETLVGILCRLAGNRLLPNLLAFKGLALIGYMASVLLIAAIVRRVAPERALSGTLLFAWNPLVLFEGLSNAHNDLLVVALLLGAIWILTLHLGQARRAEMPETSSDERFWERMYAGAALILLTAAILVKLIPLLFLPLFLLIFLAEEEGWWRRVGIGVLLVIPLLLLAIEYYSIFWHWPEVANTVLRQAAMFRMSIPSVTKEALQQYVGEAKAQVLVRPFLAAFALAYLVMLGRAAYALKGLPQRGPLAAVGCFLLGRGQAAGKRPWDILSGGCLGIFVLYLLLGNFWFWPWYLILPIALLALAGDERLFMPLLLAACAGEVSHVGWNFVWYWWGVSWDTLYQMDALVVFFMVVPALVVYAINARKTRRGVVDSNSPPLAGN